jgi:hypothetical protein
LRIHLLSIATFQYVALFLNFVLQFVLTWFILPEVFGSFAKLQLATDILLGSITVGFHTAYLQVPEENNQKLLIHTIGLGILQSILVIFLGFLIFIGFYFLDWYNLQDFILSFLLLCSTALVSIKQIFYVVYEKKQAFAFNSKINLYLNVVIAIPTMLLAFFFPTIELLVGRIVFANVLAFMVYLYLAVFDLQFRMPILFWKSWDMLLSKKIIYFSFRLYIARLIEMLQTRIDILLVSYLFGNYELGIYERIKFYATLLQSLLNGFTQRLNSVQYRLQSNINLLYHSHTIILLLSPLLYFATFIGLFVLHYFFGLATLNQLFPLYFCFWAFAGLCSFLDNIRTYLQIHHAIIRTTMVMRLVPMFCFLLGNLLVYLSPFVLSIYWVAFLYSVSYLAVFLFLKPYLYSFAYLRFSKLIYRDIQKYVEKNIFPSL